MVWGAGVSGEQVEIVNTDQGQLGVTAVGNIQRPKIQNGGWRFEILGREVSFD